MSQIIISYIFESRIYEYCPMTIEYTTSIQ